MKKFQLWMDQPRISWKFLKKLNLKHYQEKEYLKILEKIELVDGSRKFL